MLTAFSNNRLDDENIAGNGIKISGIRILQ